MMLAPNCSRLLLFQTAGSTTHAITQTCPQDSQVHCQQIQRTLVMDQPQDVELSQHNHRTSTLLQQPQSQLLTSRWTQIILLADTSPHPALSPPPAMLPLWVGSWVPHWALSLLCWPAWCSCYVVKSKPSKNVPRRQQATSTVRMTIVKAFRLSLHRTLRHIQTLHPK